MNQHQALKAQRERLKTLKLRNEILASRKEKTLFGWFSKYIRLRDCIDNGFANCVTCGKFVYFKDADCGHYIPQKNHYAVVYDEMNTACQCKNCNQYLHGNVDKYREVLIAKHGLEAVEDLEARSKVITKHLPLWKVEEMTAKYKRLAKNEAERNGVTI